LRGVFGPTSCHVPYFWCHAALEHRPERADFIRFRIAPRLALHQGHDLDLHPARRVRARIQLLMTCFPPHRRHDHASARPHPHARVVCLLRHVAHAAALAPAPLLRRGPAMPGGPQLALGWAEPRAPHPDLILLLLQPRLAAGCAHLTSSPCNTESARTCLVSLSCEGWKSTPWHAPVLQPKPPRRPGHTYAQCGCALQRGRSAAGRPYGRGGSGRGGASRQGRASSIVLAFPMYTSVIL
jgi:hypothetical protein